MARARARHDFDLSSQVAAMVYNVQCLRRSDRIAPGRLNPYRQDEPIHRRRQDAGEVIAGLTAMYCRRDG